MNIAESIALILARQGVRHAYLLTGGMVTFLADAIYRLAETQLVCMQHEQGAAFAAEAETRMTGQPCVALATSGPGATNLLTGIGSCYFDSVPMLFLTGQVNRHEMRHVRGMRQRGFQETAIVDVARPLCKYATCLTDPETAHTVLAEALETAVSGRPGPVLVDIPMDVQRAPAPALDTHTFPIRRRSPPFTDAAKLDSFLQAIAQAKRPLLMAGGGVTAGHAAGLFRQLAERLDVPVVHTLMGVDVLPQGHPNRVGMVGTYGNRYANLALAACDLLAVFGSRLDVRQLGVGGPQFLRERTILRVDCDPCELAGHVVSGQNILADVESFLLAALQRPQTVKGSFGVEAAWRGQIADWMAAYPDTEELPPGDGTINPNQFLCLLSAHTRQAVACTGDVGNNQMWTAQSLRLWPGQRLLFSGGMGAMGFSLPAAIGASLAAGNAPGQVVMISGDGGMQCNLQEMETVARLRLPIKMVIFHNNSLGMVRHFQDTLFEGRAVATQWGYSAPDFVALSRAYGIPAAEVSRSGDLPAAFDALFAEPDLPFLLQVKLPPTVGVAPRMSFGSTLASMDPPR